VDELYGTSFIVHGEWYLRYLGGDGAMVPIAGSKEVLDELRDNELVSIIGYMGKSHLGCPQRAHATGLRSAAKPRDISNLA
jgi:hypothetical protein